jgi:hypothetical protein
MSNKKTNKLIKELTKKRIELIRREKSDWAKNSFRLSLFVFEDYVRLN